MPATVFQPVPPNTYLWNTAHNIYAGSPVVVSSTAFTADTPAVWSADVVLGIALEDAGPAALGDAVNKDAITVQEYGTAWCYAKGTIAAGSWVKIGATISVTPPGYASSVTVQTVTAATQTAGGSQPYPMVGRALSASSADGDIVYIELVPGAYF